MNLKEILSKKSEKELKKIAKVLKLKGYSHYKENNKHLLVDRIINECSPAEINKVLSRNETEKSDKAEDEVVEILKKTLEHQKQTGKKQNIKQNIKIGLTILGIIIGLGYCKTNSSEQRSIKPVEIAQNDSIEYFKHNEGFKIKYLRVTQNNEELKIKFSFFVSPLERDTNRIYFYSGDSGEQLKIRRVTKIYIKDKPYFSSFVKLGKDPCYNKPDYCLAQEKALAGSKIDGYAIFRKCPKTDTLSKIHLTFFATWGGTLITEKTNFPVEQIN